MASCYVCREVCTEFYGNTKDTEIRPGVSERKGLEKMMPELSFETQIGVSFQMEREEIPTSFLLVYFTIIFKDWGQYRRGFCKTVGCLVWLAGRRDIGEERQSDVGQAVNTRPWRAFLPGKEV